MSHPIIVFPDAQLLVRNLLRTLLADAPEDYAEGVTVSTKSIPGSDENPVLPYVQVRTDQSFRSQTVNGRSTIRVVVWHKDEGKGIALANLIEGLLLSDAGITSQIRGFTSIAGVIPTEDPDTNDPMSYITLTARLKPIQL